MPASLNTIARAMLRLARGDDEPEEIDPAHLPAVLEGLAQENAKQFSGEAGVEAAFHHVDP